MGYILWEYYSIWGLSGLSSINAKLTHRDGGDTSLHRQARGEHFVCLPWSQKGADVGHNKVGAVRGHGLETKRLQPGLQQLALAL